MAEITLYHNPKCSKSRGALAILEERKADVEVIEYLKTPLGKPELERVLALLDGDATELLRKDSRFKELGLAAGDYTDADAIVSILQKHPELMQRPVAIRGQQAVIARPSELVEALLD